MNVLATRARPESARTHERAMCPRCGIDFSTRRHPGPLCRDCRDVTDPPMCRTGEHVLLGVNVYAGQCGACKRAWKARQKDRTVTDCCGYVACKCREGL